MARETVYIFRSYVAGRGNGLKAEQAPAERRRRGPAQGRAFRAAARGLRARSCCSRPAGCRRRGTKLDALREEHLQLSKRRGPGQNTQCADRGARVVLAGRLALTTSGVACPHGVIQA